MSDRLDLAALAIGALPPAEAARVAAGAERDPAAKEELRALRGLDGLLRTMAPADEPPPELRGVTMAAVAGVRWADATHDAPPRSRRRRRLRWPHLATGIAAIAAAAAFLVVFARDAGELELQTELRAANGAVATAEVREIGIGRTIEFRSDDLPILPRGEYYELWFVGPGDRPGRPNRISAGTFHPDPEGRSNVMLKAAVDPALYPVLAVTAEPGDGDPAPSGVDVLRSAPRR